MSEKITFRELIESIAKETNNSKQFTHDFIKDFVDVINNGLEKDGNVNIAGFGKFELRQMDERDGYNPQTEEKITIPAHNKIVFKPYKDLRELVNAPYAHLEAELIEEENNTKGDVQDEDTNASDQDDFIPTAPPTSHQHSEESTDELETEEEPPFDLDDDVEEDDIDLTAPVSDTEADQETADDTEDFEDLFDLDEDFDEPASSSISQEKNEEDGNGDVVEFNAGTETEEEEKDEAEESNYLDNFISPIDPSEESNDIEDSEAQAEDAPEDLVFEEEEDESFDGLEESLKEETQQNEENTAEENIEDEVEETSPFAPDFSDDTEEEKTDKDEKELSFSSPRRSRNKASKLPIIAAAVVLILVAAGAWYFTTSSNSDTPQMSAASETESTADVTTQKSDRAEAQDNQATAQSAQQNQNQQTTTPAGTAQPSTSDTPAKSNSEDLEIQEGQTLWSIAEEKYGNPRLWPWIYGNNEPLEDPDIILAGNSLSVPLPSGPQNTLNSADSVGVAKGFISTYRWYKDNQSNKARNHLWAAKSYHQDIRGITDIKIDKADLVYANQAR